MIRRFAIWFTLTALPVICAADNAWATQTHGEPEGLYVHQISHLFFIVSMGILIYHLRDRGLVKDKGWRYIQYSALLFMVWSLDAFTVHLLFEDLNLVKTEMLSKGMLSLQSPEKLGVLNLVYYITKLDHLLCVPAMLFLYLGLKRLMRESPA